MELGTRVQLTNRIRDRIVVPQVRVCVLKALKNNQLLTPIIMNKAINKLNHLTIINSKMTF